MGDVLPFKSKSNQRIEQPTPWSCMPAVAAMITGEEVSDVFIQVGHEGKPVGKDGRLGFTICEIAGYLASRSYLIGKSFIPRTTTAKWNNPSKFALSIIFPSTDPAMLIVKSSNGTHAVFWTGSVVLDPHPERPTSRDLDDYEILQWWPIVSVA